VRTGIGWNWLRFVISGIEPSVQITRVSSVSYNSAFTGQVVPVGKERTENKA
jgi:hypothetical protein